MRLKLNMYTLFNEQNAYRMVNFTIKLDFSLVDQFCPYVVVEPVKYRMNFGRCPACSLVLFFHFNLSMASTTITVWPQCGASKTKHL